MTKKNDIYSGLGKEARALGEAPEEAKKGICDYCSSLVKYA